MGKSRLLQLGGLSRTRPRAPRTSRADFEDLLRRKGSWLQEVERSPMCWGVPLGRNGGSYSAISVDVGLKNHVLVSTRELAGASPQYKQSLHQRMEGGPRHGEPESFNRAEPVPMQVLVKEDIQRLTVAKPARPPPGPRPRHPPPL